VERTPADRAEAPPTAAAAAEAVAVQVEAAVVAGRAVAVQAGVATPVRTANKEVCFSTHSGAPLRECVRVQVGMVGFIGGQDQCSEPLHFQQG
jgi:hypothetical protein